MQRPASPASPKAAAKNSPRNARSKSFPKAKLGPRGKVLINRPALPPRKKQVQLMSRDELTVDVFAKLKQEDCTSLDSACMRVFAELLDFSGNDEDWEREFFELSLDAKSEVRDGIGIEGFKTIVNDSESSCACTDDELRTISVALGKGSEVPRMIKSLTRAELVWMLFNALNKGSLGKTLDSGQLMKYAEMCGFEGTEGDWNKEYQHMCKEYDLSPEVGATMSDFETMLADDQGSCHASDTDIRSMLEDLNVTLSDAPQLQFTYDDLTSKMFFACGPGSLNRLGLASLYFYACLNGFKGTESAFTTEYMAMCLDNKWDEHKGVTRSQFDVVVKDKQTVCHCSEAGLRRNLTELVLGGTLDNAILLDREIGLIMHDDPPNDKDDEEHKDTIGTGDLDEGDSPVRGVVRTREDAPMRIQKLLKARSDAEQASDERAFQVVSAKLDPEQALRKVEKEHLHGLQSQHRFHQNVQLQSMKDMLRDSPGNTLDLRVLDRLHEPLVRSSRESLLLKDELFKDAAALMQQQAEQMQQEQRAKADASQRIQSIMQGRPSLQDGRRQDAFSFSKDAIKKTKKPKGTQRGELRISAEKPSSKSPLGSPRSQGSSPPSTPAVRSASPAKGLKRQQSKALDTSGIRKVKDVFKRAAEKAPAGEILAAKLGLYAARGTVSSQGMVQIIRDIFKLPRTDLSDKDITALCTHLDADGFGRIQLKQFLDFIGIVLTATQQELLKGKDVSPAQSDCESNVGEDEIASRAATARAHRQILEAASQEMEHAKSFSSGKWNLARTPAKEQVTHTFLSSHPNFIMKILKLGDEEMSLHALERLGHRGVNQLDLRGCTVLHLAAENNLADFCEKVMSRAAFVGASARDYSDWTALHRGARMGAADACRKIMVHPRFTALNYASPKDGWSALHLAAMHGHQDICFMMVHDPRCDIAAKDMWGRTALHAASEHGHSEAIQALIDKYSSDKCNIQNKWSRSALETVKGGTDSRVGKIMEELLGRTDKGSDDERPGTGVKNPIANQRGNTAAVAFPRNPYVRQRT